MEPKIWGEHAWIFLHTITLNYPEEPTFSDKYNYQEKHPNCYTKFISLKYNFHHKNSDV